MATRVVSWGDALVVQQFKHTGGLKAAVETVRRVVGPQIGVRATFQNLLKVEDPAELSERERFRAWALIAAFGEDPTEWGLPDAVVPVAFDPAALKNRFLVELRGASAGDELSRGRTGRYVHVAVRRGTSWGNLPDIAGQAA